MGTLTRPELSKKNQDWLPLCGANLYAANLYAANLYAADLCGADLTDVKVSNNTLFYALQCPKTGSFLWV